MTRNKYSLSDKDCKKKKKSKWVISDQEPITSGVISDHDPITCRVTSDQEPIACPEVLNLVKARTLKECMSRLDWFANSADL